MRDLALNLISYFTSLIKMTFGIVSVLVVLALAAVNSQVVPSVVENCANENNVDLPDLKSLWLQNYDNVTENVKVRNLNSERFFISYVTKIFSRLVLHQMSS